MKQQTTGSRKTLFGVLALVVGTLSAPDLRRLPATFTAKQTPAACLSATTTMDCVVDCKWESCKEYTISLDKKNNGRLLVRCHDTEGYQACKQITVEKTHVAQKAYLWCGTSEGYVECEKSAASKGVKYFCESANCGVFTWSGTAGNREARDFGRAGAFPTPVPADGTPTGAAHTPHNTRLLAECVDDDLCLQERPGWGEEYACKFSKKYCVTYPEDMACCCKTCQTTAPTLCPSIAPTGAPTVSPTSFPTGAPTLCPTSSPTSAPTSSPTSAPTASPTHDKSECGFGQYYDDDGFCQPCDPGRYQPEKMQESCIACAAGMYVSGGTAPTLTPTAAPSRTPTGLPPTRCPTRNPTPSPTDKTKKRRLFTEGGSAAEEITSATYGREYLSPTHSTAIPARYSTADLAQEKRVREQKAAALGLFAPTDAPLPATASLPSAMLGGMLAPTATRTPPPVAAADSEWTAAYSEFEADIVHSDVVLLTSSPRSEQQYHPGDSYQDGTDEDEQDEVAWKEDMKLMGNFEGRAYWYPGTVAKVHLDGSLNIKYTDGGMELFVSPEWAMEPENEEHDLEYMFFDVPTQAWVYRASAVADKRTDKNETSAPGETATGNSEAALQPTLRRRLVGHFGAVSCLACAAGRYNDKTGASNKTGCQQYPQSYYAAVEASGCTECTKGKYGAKEISRGRHNESEACLDCLDVPCTTDECSLLFLQRCVACSPGYFKIDSTCRRCGRGRYSSASDAAECLKCPAGKFQDAEGAPFCWLCDSGQYNVGVENDKCKNCTQGEYQGSAGSRECLICDASKYQPGVGQSSCKGCPSGYAQKLTKQIACEGCSIGRVASKVSIVCQACPAGQHQQHETRSKCDDCAAGLFQPLSGQGVCHECPVGKWQDTMQQAFCKGCEAGTRQPSAGGKRCVDCEAGHFSDSQAYECKACVVGMHEPGNSSRACKDCPTGYHQSATGKTICEPCSAGKFSREGYEYCSMCAPGKYQKNGAQGSCAKCLSGRFQKTGGETACAECPAGQYQPSEGQVYCEMCAAGYYNPSSGSNTTCLSCQLGYFSAASASVCKLCAAGKHSPLGADQCNDCPRGHFGKSDGACVDHCEAGKYSLEGAADCTNCPAGKFQNTTRKHLCMVCEIGMFQERQTETSCRVCPSGKMQPTESAALCVLCESGQSQTATAQIHCLQCNGGKFSGTGADRCKSCDAGKRSDAAASICEPCLAGRSSERNSSSCAQCVVGRYSVSGASSCTKCPAGQFGNAGSPSTSLAHCSDCPDGKFQDRSGEKMCKKCAAGTFGEGRSISATCTGACATGSWSYEGSVNCTVCTIGKFGGGDVARESEAHCLACASGKLHVL
jgi:hypothetical protein